MVRNLFFSVSGACILATCVFVPTQSHADSPVPGPAVVYENSFEAANPIDDAWSIGDRLDMTQSRRRFIGRFQEEAISLSLKNLPKHRAVRISFDLFIIGRWHGQPAGYQPTAWTLDVSGGPQLIDTNFSNWPELETCSTQAYPGFTKLGVAPAHTGASEINKLGYRYNDKFGNRDAVYPMSFVFAHTGDAVRFDFEATGIRAVQPSSWGLDNVKVELLEEFTPAKLSKQQFDAAWATLLEGDARKTGPAVRRLVAAGDAAVAYVHTHRRDLLTHRDNIRKLIAQLDHDDYRTREAATKKLRELGANAREVLTAVTRPDVIARLSPEQRYRIQSLLNDEPGESRMTPDLRRLHHVRLILKMINTAKAKALLEEI